MFFRFCVLFAFAFLPGLYLSAAGIADFIPRQSQQVIQINMTEILGKGNVANLTVSETFRHIGFQTEMLNRPDIRKLFEYIWVVTPDLTKKDTFIFVRTGMTEPAFTAAFSRLAGGRHVSVNGSERSLKLTVPSKVPGMPDTTRTVVYRFLSADTAVFAVDSLVSYWKLPRGIPAGELQEKLIPDAWISGFTAADKRFQQKYPVIPPFRRAVYSVRGSSRDLSLNCRLAAVDAQSAEQLCGVFQQYVLLGGVLLNKAEPELVQDWISAFRISRNGSAVSVTAVFPESFLSRLSEVSGNLLLNSGKQ